MRRRVIRMVNESSPGSETLQCCLGYPEDLPNLSLEKAPKRNKKPAGVQNSHHERKSREELPPYY
jgi:hypothetical protein